MPQALQTCLVCRRVIEALDPEVPVGRRVEERPATTKRSRTLLPSEGFQKFMATGKLPCSRKKTGASKLGGGDYLAAQGTSPFPSSHVQVTR
jgi:hypothetical protein